MDKNYIFNAEDAVNKTIQWIRNWFNKNGSNCNAIVGISGGKDSTIVAKLCCEALGTNRVVGVLMPQGKQLDIQDSYSVVDYLGIDFVEVNIGKACDSLLEEIMQTVKIKEQTKINLPARIRMSTLYAVSQSLNGRVANTCNLSEDWIGYSTRYGDSVGDFSPISNFTVTELLKMGEVLGIPKYLLYKKPSDGLTGKTDEDNFGFTYETLDKYIRTNECLDINIKNKIDNMHEKNLFKLQLMDSFKYQ